MQILKVFFVGLVLVLGKISVAQDFSNKGTDFFITFPAHVDGTNAVMGIYITSDQDATGQVQVGTGGTTINFNITANTVRRIFLGNSPASDASNIPIYQDQIEGIKAGSAIRVTSNQPVVVYAHIIRSARSASSLILPTPTWGREYVVPSYASNTSSGASGGRGVLNVVAKEANTIIEITPRQSSVGNTRPAGVVYTVTLANPGDVYQVQYANQTDISGTVVRSIASGTSGCKPITVFAGSTWAAFGCVGASGGDNLYQQIFPTRSWGRTFLTAPFANRQRDIIRVFAFDPTTVITRTENGASSNLTLNANGFVEFETNLPNRISSDKPIQVVQYMNSQTCDTRNPQNCVNGSTCPWPADPEMVILNPIEQTINNITLFSAHQNFVPSGQSNVNQCYLNIIIPTVAAPSFRVNGAAPSGNFQPIPGTSYSFLQENVTAISQINPIQQLRADSSFSCIAYGYGQVESYGYNAGTNVKDLSQFITIRDPYQSLDAPSACQSIPSKLYITLPFPATSLTWKFYGIFPDVVINNPVPDSTYQRDGKTLNRYPLPSDYNFSNPGVNKVTVVAVNPTSDGCSGEQNLDFEIVVHNKPTADFNINFSSCIIDSARFVSTATVPAGNSITQWNWTIQPNVAKTGSTIAHLFTASGTYNVAHAVRSNFGCVSDTVIKPVTVNPRPVAAFNLSGPYCINRPITFANTSTTAVGTITRWYWLMGNGQVFDRNSGAPFTYAYPATGTYTVKLVVTSGTGCPSDTVQQTITVGTIPMPAFTLPEVCLQDAFAEFTNTTTISDGTINQVTYLWNFGNPNATPGNPNSSTQTNGRHRYSSSGNFNVKLVATSNQGCIDSLTQTLTVNGDNPNASFDLVNSGNLCSNFPVQIRNRSTVNFGVITRVIVHWNWGVSNNDTTRDENPVIDKIYTKQYPIFSSPAVRQFQIRLQAFSGDVCVDDFIRTINLQAKPDPKINTIPSICLDAIPRQITQGFDAGNNTGQGTYSGPGITNPNGLFDPKIPGVGVHTIKYVYATTAGCSDSTTSTIRVWPSPTANFDISAITCLNGPITFTSTSVANANNITTWNWNFNDGNTETRNNGNPFTRTYPVAQNYFVTLQVITDSGCVSTITPKALTIHPLPVVNFDLPAAVVCLPEGRAQFTNRTTIGGTGGSPIAYLWNFGVAGATSTQDNPVYNFSSTGPFTVSLRATSARGCIDSVAKSITNIIAQPLANWSANPAEVCLGTSITFNDQSNPLNNTITNWNWRFGDGTTATQQNPVKTYAAAGTYTVSMFYNTSIGCPSDTITKQVTVHPFPVVNAGPDQFVLAGGEVVLRATASGSSNYQYQWTPPTWLSDPAILQPTAKPQQDVTYTLTVTGIGGCSASDEVFITYLLKPEIPTAFSPNSDGINDTWIIKHLDSYPGATVQIFDRYGKAILKSTGYNKPWDGTSNGQPVPVGVYYYIVDPKNGLKPLTGSVTVVR
jgi:gliding motility-associated-like protein